MSTFLNAVESLFGFVVEASIGACLVIGAVLVLQRLFRNLFTPRWRYLLWTLLLVRLALPWAPSSPLSAANLFPDSRVIPLAQYDQTGEMSPLFADEKSALHEQVGDISVATPPQIEVAVSTPETWNVGLFVSIGWLAGVLVFCLHILWASLDLRKRLRDAEQVEDPRLLMLFHDCETRLRLRPRAQLLMSAAFRHPAVCGLMRPCVVIPRHTLDVLTDAEVRHVFLHELSHLKRGDLPMAWFAAALQALHWFNPVVWYGLYRMRQDREFACDALSVSAMTPVEADTYGQTLIRLMEQRGGPMRLPSAVGILESKSQLRRRIDMIMRYTSSPYRLSWMGLVVLVLCGAVLLTRATAAPPNDDHPKSLTSSIEERFSQEIPFETYAREQLAFKPGDSIEITELRGSSPRIEMGQIYRVKGHYTLKSQDRARLNVYCANGYVESDKKEPNDIVEKGEGEFVREFTLMRPGFLFVGLGSAEDVKGFGAMWFRLKALPEDSPDARLDLAIDNVTFKVFKGDDGNALLIAHILNKGNIVSPKFEICFYHGEPETGKPQIHGGDAVHPGETWSECCPVFALEPGENTYYVQIDPKNTVQEADKSNNAAKLTVNGKKVVKEVIEVE